MANDDRSDAELLGAWCDGDEDAGDRLLRSVFPRLYRFLFNKIGDDTREIIQQTMLACVEHRDKLADCVDFESYLLRMARNKLYDFLRKRGRGREDLPGDLPSVHELKTSMASVLGRQARDAQVLSALRSLPVDLQVVIELHYWNELTTAEIAEVLEIPVGTVKSRLRRAREEFEQILRADDPVATADVIGSVRI
jgi:RNA polymerase sigma factor (sigma-70 family)